MGMPFTTLLCLKDYYYYKKYCDKQSMTNLKLQKYKFTKGTWVLENTI